MKGDERPQGQGTAREPGGRLRGRVEIELRPRGVGRARPGRPGTQPRASRGSGPEPKVATGLGGLRVTAGYRGWKES